jgi:hypothetical protein
MTGGIESTRELQVEREFESLGACGGLNRLMSRSPASPKTELLIKLPLQHRIFYASPLLTLNYGFLMSQCGNICSMS